MTKMKTIIAGSRTIDNYDLVKYCIKESGFDITEVVSGCASGADRLGEKYAIENNIPIKKFPAQWNTYGKSAGYKRNVEMAEYSDALIVIIENNSRGSTHMKNIAEKAGLKIYSLIL